MKKLNLRLVEERLTQLNLSIFTPQDLKIIFGASQRAVEGFLHYNTKNNSFIRLKKGLYILKRNPPTDYVIANHLYVPSYISLDTALSFYHLIPETVYAVSSITNKPTREIVALDRLFEYRKIKKQAYTGFIATRVDGTVVLIATPEKAVADLLYFVSLGKRDFNDRIKLGRINDQKLKQYLKVFDQKRLTSLVGRLLSR